MNIEKQVVDAVGNKREPKLGDKVIHRLSGKHGAVSEIGLVDNQHIVSVTLPSGQIMAKLNWREVSLDKMPVSGLEAPYAPDAVERFNTSKQSDPYVEFAKDLKGPISTDSILEELV